MRVHNDNEDKDNEVTRVVDNVEQEPQRDASSQLAWQLAPWTLSRRGAFWVM